MASTPKRLSGPAQLSTAATTIYTVPAATKTVVRYIHVQNPSGSPVNFTMSIGTDAAGTRIYDAYSIPGAAPGVTGSVLDLWCYHVLEAAEVLQAFCGTSSTLVITVDGDEKTLG